MERPILFSTPMVQAILNGKKTMTRRVVKLPGYIKPQENGLYTLLAEGDAYQDQHLEELIETGYVKCPYGKLGDILWVRETWKDVNPDGGAFYHYKADSNEPISTITIPWRPSIFMPRAACRIKLLIKDIRVERLQDMNFNDWKADFCPSFIEQEKALATFTGHEYMKSSMKAFWDSINAKRGYGWDVNPWVWVVSFERIEVTHD